jgi:hypothetical protein
MQALPSRADPRGNCCRSARKNRARFLVIHCRRLTAALGLLICTGSLIATSLANYYSVRSVQQVSMEFVVRVWLVALTTLAVAQSRPQVFSEKAVITVSVVAYTEFDGTVVATRSGDTTQFDDFVAFQP